MLAACLVARTHAVTQQGLLRANWVWARI